MSCSDRKYTPMDYPTNLENKTLTLNMAISPLQWGECPGNLRFTLYKTNIANPIGSLSIGGMAAYKLQKRLETEGSIEATVVRGKIMSQFILTHLTTANGSTPWKEALFEEAPKATKRVVRETINLDAARARVKVDTTKTTRRVSIEEFAKVEV